MKSEIQREVELFEQSDPLSQEVLKLRAKALVEAGVSVLQKSGITTHVLHAPDGSVSVMFTDQAEGRE